jgi:hypothetical protein
MNLFVAYRFTGEDPKELEEILGSVCQSLRLGGNNVFCSLEHEADFREQGLTTDQIYNFCLEKFSEHEGLFVFVRSVNRSKGIELELDRAKMLSKPVYVATPPHIHLYREGAKAIIEYNNIDQLRQQLLTYKF